MAREGASRNHENRCKFDGEIACDDVHEKEFDLAKVTNHDGPELDYSHQMKVSGTVLEQRCRNDNLHDGIEPGCLARWSLHSLCTSRPHALGKTRGTPANVTNTHEHPHVNNVCLESSRQQ